MNIKEAVMAALKEMVLPELAVMKQEQAEIKTTLLLTNKRLDDINIHLVDQSRRIDALREELSNRIDSIEEKLTGRIDAVREELSGRINSVEEKLTGRIDALREELGNQIIESNKRIDAVREELSGQISETNNRLNHLYEVIVRREEHQQLNERVLRLEHDVQDLKRHLAA